MASGHHGEKNSPGFYSPEISHAVVSLPPRILEITAAVGDHLQGHSGSFSLEAPALALAVVDLPKGPFSSLSFGVSSTLGVLNPEVPR